MTATVSAALELDAQFPAQNYILINGDVSPGKAIVRVGPGVSPRGWDERNGYAMSGATLVPKGNPLGVFSVRFEFWDPTQMPAWYAFAAKYFDESVRFNPGSIQPRALGISHPILEAPPLRITEVVVTDATGLDQEDGGLWWCEVFFKRFRKAVPAKQPPLAAIPAAATATPTAQDNADLEIQKLSAEFQSLLGGP